MPARAHRGLGHPSPARPCASRTTPAAPSARTCSPRRTRTPRSSMRASTSVPWPAACSGPRWPSATRSAGWGLPRRPYAGRGCASGWPPSGSRCSSCSGSRRRATGPTPSAPAADPLPRRPLRTRRPPSSPRWMRDRRTAVAADRPNTMMNVTKASCQRMPPVMTLPWAWPSGDRRTMSPAGVPCSSQSPRGSPAARPPRRSARAPRPPSHWAPARRPAGSGPSGSPGCRCGTGPWSATGRGSSGPRRSRSAGAGSPP